MVNAALRLALATAWDDCTPEQRELRRINFGSAPPSIDRHNTWASALIERYQAGLPLSKADRKDARRLMRQLETAR